MYYKYGTYISLVVELRQIAVAKALTLLDDYDTAEDVAGEVLLRLWEGHKDLHNDADKVKHLANLMARNLSLNLLRQRRRHPIMRIFHRREKDDVETFNIPDDETVYNLLPLGYPADDCRPGPLHDSRKPLDETVTFL